MKWAKRPWWQILFTFATHNIVIIDAQMLMHWLPLSAIVHFSPWPTTTTAIIMLWFCWIPVIQSWIKAFSATDKWNLSGWCSSSYTFYYKYFASWKTYDCCSQRGIAMKSNNLYILCMGTKVFNALSSQKHTQNIINIHCQLRCGDWTGEKKRPIFIIASHIRRWMKCQEIHC